MRVKEIIDLIKPLRYQGNPVEEVKGISYDSRRVNPGDIFVCIKGSVTNGHLYAKEALSRGSIGLITEKWLNIPDCIQIQVKDSREALAKMSAAFYDYPSRKITILGVTGTNGKTTTTFLLESIFLTQGRKTGLIGTVESRIKSEKLLVERTTPQSLDLQRIFNQMVRSGVEVVVMEVSSHAIDQKRINHTQFDALIFTNLSQDHLDYHKTFENYFEIKRSLFEKFPIALGVINVDDFYGRKIFNSISSKKVSYGIENKADFQAKKIILNEKGSKFCLVSPTEEIEIHLKIKGLFNVYNALAAAATASLLGIPLEVIKEGLGRLKVVPGRFEFIQAGQDFLVVVDYAHTPDSLKKVIETSHQIAGGRVITVFGCGGDRDRTKRPLMGKISAEKSNFTIITSDNPRSEDPLAIMKEIEAGLKEFSPKVPYLMIPNRKEAIFKAIFMAESGDLVLIAGKGHENYQIFSDKVIHFDDREVAQQAIRERLKREVEIDTH